jgi:bacterioferritin
MKANAEVLGHLQTALSMELAAVHQYLLHAHVLEDWGLDKLAAKMREEMREELGHADAFARRIVFLKGDPNMKAAKTPKRAQAIQDLFEADLADEEEAIRFYSQASQAADKAGDIGTRELFTKTVIEEEGHMAWLETQLALLNRLGEPAYLAMQIGDSGAQRGAQ